MAKDMALESAAIAGLIYVHDHDPGITRRGAPQAFDYRHPDGGLVKSERTLARIHKLAIPPAWTDVWICPEEGGHIQAVGRDARGRKQYRYHDDWKASRDEVKFERVCAFGRALPRLRRQVEADLAHRGLTRGRVLAAVVRLLELTLIRVGNDEYARANNSFGLTTLRKRHVSLTGVGAVFEFRGKSGVTHRTGFHDARIARILHGCQDLRGQRLFQYLDDDGERRPVESADVNAYLRSAMGEDFSAKDFRTWAGTLAAAVALAGEAAPQAAAKPTVKTCVAAVAGLLGNTPTVCRSSYIHPAVFDAYHRGALPRRLTGGGRSAELALLTLLKDADACP
jgi:DNA topoisomerase-1